MVSEPIIAEKAHTRQRVFQLLLAEDALAKADDVALLTETYRDSHRAAVREVMAAWGRLRRRNPDVGLNDLHHAIAQIARERALRWVAEVALEMAAEILPSAEDVLRGEEK